MSEFGSVESGFAGEAKTIAFLSDDFWQLRRSVDAGGIDLILQSKIDARRDAVVDQFDRLAFVQSKQFRFGGSADIASIYVDSPTGGREGYFVFVHSFEVNGEPVSWFFSAHEVVAHWRRQPSEQCYRFNPNHVDNGARFARRTRDEVREMIEGGMHRHRSEISELIMSSFFNIYSNVREVSSPCGVYLLLRQEGCWSAFYRSSETADATPVDPRRDLFNYSGYFAWGYAGTGTRFLAHSLLMHFFGGRRPTREEVQLVVEHLLSRLDGRMDHKLDSKRLFLCLTGEWAAHDASSLSPTGRLEFERLAKLYDPASNHAK